MFSYHLEPPNPKKPYAYARNWRTSQFDKIRHFAKAIAGVVWSPIVWENGVRSQDTFLYSDLMALDFDEPGFTLKEAEKAFCDMVHVIGTTKSHALDKRGVTCDRFRVVIPWSERISDVRTYRYNMQLVAKRYPLDKKALDGARYFFPCVCITSVSEEGYTQDIHTPPLDFESGDYLQKCRHLSAHHGTTGSFPRWLRDFLYEGKPLEGGRNYSCYRSAISLLEHGYSDEQIMRAVMGAPMKMDDFSPHEIETAVRNGIARFYKNMGKI